MPVTVVGGAYHEVSIDPSSHQLWGSGLRAARLLNALGAPAVLVTCIDDDSRPELDALSALHDLRIDARPRDGAVGYVYETPVQPAVRHGVATSAALDVVDDVVLGFGMAETTWTARAQRAVIDPQHSPVESLLAATTAEHRAVVLNEHEARRMTGRGNLADAAHALLDLDVEVAVIKCGARGGLVVADGVDGSFGAVPTARVDPIGSGDAFTAGFTDAWAVRRQPPVVAAAFASRVAAGHSVAGASAFTSGVLEAIGQPAAFDPNACARVYLAAPFFDLGQRTLVRVVRDALLQLGVDVFSPLHEIGPGGDEVAQPDIDGLAGTTAVLALLDGADAGTIFETGWATRAGIPVVGYAENRDDHAWTMLRGTGSTIYDDLTTAVYNAAWTALANGRTP